MVIPIPGTHRTDPSETTTDGPTLDRPSYSFTPFADQEAPWHQVARAGASVGNPCKHILQGNPDLQISRTASTTLQFTINKAKMHSIGNQLTIRVGVQDNGMLHSVCQIGPIRALEDHSTSLWVNQRASIVTLSFIAHRQLAAIAVRQEHVRQWTSSQRPTTGGSCRRRTIHCRQDMDLSIRHGIRSTRTNKHHTLLGANLNVSQFCTLEVIGQVGKDLTIVDSPNIASICSWQNDIAKLSEDETLKTKTY